MQGKEMCLCDVWIKHLVIFKIRCIFLEGCCHRSCCTKVYNCFKKNILFSFSFKAFSFLSFFSTAFKRFHRRCKSVCQKEIHFFPMFRGNATDLSSLQQMSVHDQCTTLCSLNYTKKTVEAVKVHFPWLLTIESDGQNFAEKKVASHSRLHRDIV